MRCTCAVIDCPDQAADGPDRITDPKCPLHGTPVPKDLELESRHSDYGADAGGYSVLRFRGEWIGRVEVESREAAKKLIEHHEKLLNALRAVRGIVPYFTRKDCDCSRCKVLRPADELLAEPRSET